MSRLSGLSPSALRALFSPDADDNLICLLTFSGGNIPTPIRIADGYTQRLSENDTEIIYGVVSNGLEFTFLPFEINLPTEEDSAPRCNITMHDVTRYLLPSIRELQSAPNVKIELVLSSNPDVVEIEMGEFLLANISYNADTINAELTLEGLEMEPFPAGTFTPSYFPGMF